MTATDSRQKMIETAAVVMRERGVEATSFSEVLARSGAPRGSIYHHFPGGKAQLIEEATRYAGEFTAAGLVAALGEDDPVAAVTAFCAGWIRILRKTDFGAGCPVVAAALEGEHTPGAREAAAAAFLRWETLLTDAIETAHRFPRARPLARDADHRRRSRARSCSPARRARPPRSSVSPASSTARAGARTPPIRR